MKMFSENAQTVIRFLQANPGGQYTANDIAEATGLEVRSVNGIVTSAFQKKGLMERIPAEIELSDGSHKAVKFIKLTEAGKNFDPDATDEK